MMLESDKAPANLIRDLRGDMTQHEFAQLTGISRSSIANYESGRTVPQRYALAKIKQAAKGFRNTGDERLVNNSTRQQYRRLSEIEKAQVDAVKELGAMFICLCHEIGSTDPDGERLASRDLSLAVTHAEDAVMRAVRHITK